MAKIVVKTVCCAAAVGGLALAIASCGASRQGVYEGDLRFERCNALDSSPAIKPSIRKACWDTWLERYLYGQNRDRVEYARGRSRALGASSNFDDPWEAERADAAVPQPTSALQPPPMMLQAPSAGVSPPAAPSASSPTDAPDEKLDPKTPRPHD